MMAAMGLLLTLMGAAMWQVLAHFRDPLAIPSVRRIGIGDCKHPDVRYLCWQLAVSGAPQTKLRRQ